MKQSQIVQPASSVAPCSAAGETEKNTPCWCGEPNPYYAPVPSRCDGHGYNNCLCGGDFCVCHNHGEVECFGCPDCEISDDDYNDD
jgi:hypothetical protein